MAQIRSFIAIELSPPLKDKIAEIQQVLRAAPAEVRWVRPEGVHLTLKFLGAVEEERVAAIAAIITQCAATIPPFTLSVRSLGAFPNENNPKVVWAGVDNESGTLLTLQQSLEKKLAAIGFKEERRPFAPHLTLGRLKSPRGKKELVARLERYKNYECGTFEADEIFLFKSDLTPQGAVYTKLRAFPLHS